MPFVSRLGLALSCAVMLAVPVAGVALAADQSRAQTPLVAQTDDANAILATHDGTTPGGSESSLARDRRLERRRGQALAQTALQYVGYPYRWGGTSPASGFDCSGFVMFVYGTIGIELSHDQLGQLASGRHIETDELLPGDLLIFQNTYRPGPSHSGIYIGDGQFAHAADERHGVTVNSVWDGYWGQRYYGATRPGR